MTTATRSPRYTSVAIGLHWAMAGLLIGMIWLGWNMETEEGRPIEWLYQLHKSIGITILILTIARVIWRLMNPPPPLPAEMKTWEKRASHAVHIVFYAIMIASPLAGWALSSMAEVQVPTVLYETVSWPHIPVLATLPAETKAALYTPIEFLHSKSAWLIIAMLAVHVGGALKHECAEEDGVLKRMIPGLFGKTSGPVAPPRGFFVAFGSAIGAFMLVAGLPLAANALQSDSAGIQAAPSGISANWQINQEASSITFSGVHDGDTFTGEFGNWSANVSFDPENLAAAEAYIEIDTLSTTTNKKLYTDSVKAAEWFNVKEWPQATVRVENFKASDAGYVADATVRLKAMEVTVPLEFTFTPTPDGSAIVSGEAVLQRKPLNLGQDSDPTADWVSEDVTVSIAIEADKLP